MNWKKGDIAICINAGHMGIKPDLNNPPLRLNSEYIVQAICICPCGLIKLDVGIHHSNKILCCSSCDRESVNEPIWWCNNNRFMKKQSMEEQLEEALNNEDYELATTIRDKQ